MQQIISLKLFGEIKRSLLKLKEEQPGATYYAHTMFLSKVISSTLFFTISKTHLTKSAFHNKAILFSRNSILRKDDVVVYNKNKNKLFHSKSIDNTDTEDVNTGSVSVTRVST